MKPRLPHNFEPRQYQEEVLFALEEGYKKVLWIVHRRAGKDITALNYIIKKMYEEMGVYYYVFPTYAQAKKVIWDSIRSDGFRILDHFPACLVENSNSQEMKIRLKNGSLFQLVGSDNYDSLMGTNPKGIVFSEYALQDPKAYEFIRPILTANKGWALFISTPRGKNHLWDLYQMAKGNKDWWVQVLTVDDTKAISVEDIEKDRLEGMSEEIIQQEYYCSFDRGVDGSYYAKQLAILRDKCQIKRIEYDSYAEVHTAWDLGFCDSTCIFFYQLIQGEIRIINYYENHGEGLAHYVKELDKIRIENGYVYGKHYVPHDASARSNQTGHSYVRYAQEMGIKLQNLPREEIDIGIERVRKYLPRCWFDQTKCEKGLKALENYQKTFNDKMKVYSDNPLHNWASHGADAFRYLCMSAELYQGSSGLSKESYNELKRKYSISRGENNNSILGN